MTDISATSVETRELPEGQLALQFELTWSPPSSANGILTEYEVAIGTQPVSAGAFLYHSTFPVSVFSCHQNTYPVVVYSPLMLITYAVVL